MGVSYDIGMVEFPVQNGTINMVTKVTRKTPLRNPKVAFWITDATGNTWVSMVRAIRLPKEQEVMLLEDAAGTEGIAAVMSYNRLGMPQELEAGVELFDADMVSITELPLRTIRAVQGDPAVLFTP